jgi:hypothetical protein
MNATTRWLSPFWNIFHRLDNAANESVARSRSSRLNLSAGTIQRPVISWAAPGFSTFRGILPGSFDDT